MMWFGLVLFVSGLDLGQNMYCFHDMIHMILILKKHAMFVGMDGCLTLVYSTVYILYIYLCACVVGVHVVLLHKCLPLV